MKHVQKSVLLPYSPREMYELVTDVLLYPQFLPWCERAEIVESRDDGITARLHLRYAGIHHAFTTRNTHVPNSAVLMALVDGPFSLLDGQWRFVPLGGGDAETPACRVGFELRYAFSSVALEMVVSPVFDRIANTFVESFVKRAEQIHGPR